MKKIKIHSTETETRLLDKTYHLVTPEMRSAIQEALDAVNGKATAFTISQWHVVVDAVARAERYLISHNVAESDRNGAVATLRPEGPYSNSYKNSAISTEITLKRAAGVWALVAVDRVDVYPRNPEKFKVTISDKATVNLVKRTLGAFGRSEMPVAA